MNPETMFQWCPACGRISEFRWKDGKWVCIQCGRELEDNTRPEQDENVSPEISSGQGADSALSEFSHLGVSPCASFTHKIMGLCALPAVKDYEDEE